MTAVQDWEGGKVPRTHRENPGQQDRQSAKIENRLLRANEAADLDRDENMSTASLIIQEFAFIQSRIFGRKSAARLPGNRTSSAGSARGTEWRRRMEGNATRGRHHAPGGCRQRSR